MATEITFFEKSQSLLIVRPHFDRVPLRLSEIPLPLAIISRQHAILGINEQRGKINLIFLKNRNLVCEDSELFNELQEEFPSIHIVPDPYRPYAAKGLAFEDDNDDLHFKLKYC